MFTTVLNIFQIIVSVLLIAVILLQVPEEGMSAVFGGGGESYRSKRNVEKFFVVATIVLAALLVGISLILLFPQS